MDRRTVEINRRLAGRSARQEKAQSLHKELQRKRFSTTAWSGQVQLDWFRVGRAQTVDEFKNELSLLLVGFCIQLAVLLLGHELSLIHI